MQNYCANLLKCCTFRKNFISGLKIETSLAILMDWFLWVNFAYFWTKMMSSLEFLGTHADEATEYCT